MSTVKHLSVWAIARNISDEEFDHFSYGLAPLKLGLHSNHFAKKECYTHRNIQLHV